MVNVVTAVEGFTLLLLCLLLTAELVAKLYEAAVKKVPLSEEYHSHLFMAYARVGEYKKMQQVRQSPSMNYFQQDFTFVLHWSSKRNILVSIMKRMLTTLSLCLTGRNGLV